MKPVREASEEERIRMVREIFSAIPRWYDFLNHFLSLRRDVAWRRKTVEMMRFFKTHAFLDVATGTADLAIAAALQNRDLHVTGVDFVPGMIALGREKVRELALSERITLLEGDAMHLPFEDGSFDVSAVAFGIRNMPDRVGALKEMSRVVVPGGQVMVLELTTPQSRFMRRLYSVYLTGILPRIGRLFSGNPDAYRYLAESIMDFPSPDRFTALMEEAGLVDVKKHPLTFGVAHLHIGYRKS